MKRKTWIPLSLLVLLLIGGTVAWAFWPTEAPEVNQVKALASKMFDEETSDEERQQLRDEMRQIRDKVPEDRRREVFRAMGEQFRERMTEHVAEFMDLPEEDRNDFLDRDIDRMEKMRGEWEKRRSEEGGDRGNRPDAARGEGGRGPGAGSPGGGEGRGRGGRETSQEDREQRRRARLDRTSPETRASFSEYFKAINERREERGLEPMRGRGFGRRGPR